MRWPVEDTEASAVYIAPLTRACAGPDGPWIFGVPVSIDVSVLARISPRCSSPGGGDGPGCKASRPSGPQAYLNSTSCEKCGLADLPDPPGKGHAQTGTGHNLHE